MAALSFDLCTSNVLTGTQSGKNMSPAVIDVPIPAHLMPIVVALIVGRIRQGGRKKDAAKKAAPVKEAAPAPKEPAL
jgi:hypothetical protein